MTAEAEALRAELARVTAERDALRCALESIAYMDVLAEKLERSGNIALASLFRGRLLRARFALSEVRA